MPVHVLTVDKVKEAFLLHHWSMNWEEVDARNTSMAPSDYCKLVVDPFNDPDWHPSTECLPELHEDFEMPIFCPLTVALIDIKNVKDQLSSAIVLLQMIVTKWEHLGSGWLMFHPEDDANYKSEEDIYCFEDGDKCKNFLSHANNHSYILYWWHIAYTHQLLTSAHKSLCSGISVDYSQVPTTHNVSSHS